MTRLGPRARAAAASAIVVALVAATPAVAVDDTTVVVDGDHFAGAGVRLVHQGCTDPGLVPPSTPAAVINQDAPLPTTGQGYLAWAPTQEGFGLGPLVPVAKPTEMTSFSVEVLSPNSLARPVAAVEFVEPGRAGIWKGTANLPQETISGWHTVTIPSTQLFQWRHFDAAGTLDEAAGSALTVKNFVNDRGGDNEGAHVGVLYGCDGDPFSLDAVRVSTEAGTTTYDLEAYQSTLGLRRADKQPTAITAGARVRLAAALRRAFEGTALSGPVKIEVRDYGQQRWRTIASGSSGSDGLLEAQDMPLRAARYRASYPGTSTVEGSTSSLAIQVRSNVPTRLDKRRVVRGHMFRMIGRVDPGRRAKIAVQLYINDRWRTVRRDVTAKNGEFAVRLRAKQLGKTFWRVQAMGGKGSLTGNSKWLTLRTVRPPHSGGGTDPGPIDPGTPPPTEPPPPPPPGGPL